MFGMDKGGGAPAMGGAPMASPRPMPRPSMVNGQVATPSAPQGGGGLFPNMPAQQRYDMTMELLKSGMQMGANSGSPLAAFLSPLAGAVIGGSASNRLAKAQGSQNDELAASLIPGGMTPRVQQLTDALDNPSTPDYLKSLAKSELEAALKPMGSGGGKRYKGGKVGGATGGAPATGGAGYGGQYLVDRILGADGIYRGRNKKGQYVPFTDENGNVLRGAPAGAVDEYAAPTVITGADGDYSITEQRP